MNLSDAIERLIRIGPSEAMREDERSSGFEPIRPGERDWFPATDWSPGDVVSIRGSDVRIVAIKAKAIGKGTFSRLITAIAVAGLTPIVVEPMFDMPDILKRWGWSRQIVGSGFEKEEQWRPSQAWLAERAITKVRT